MIRVHSYCSYKLSTSGFMYGTFDITQDSKEEYFLSEDNINNVVSSAFIHSIIKRLKGKLPKENDKYIFLFKKFTYKYDDDHDDVGGDVSLNMAFEFDNYKDFYVFMRNFENRDQSEISKQLADCIFPDISIKKFKFKIRKEKINTWLDNMIKDNDIMIKDNDNMIKDNDNIDRDKSYRSKLHIYTTSGEDSQTTEKELQEIFNFDTKDENGEEVGISYSKDQLYIYPTKKKEMYSQITTPLIKRNHLPLLICLSVILVLYLALAMTKVIQKNNPDHVVPDSPPSTDNTKDTTIKLSNEFTLMNNKVSIPFKLSDLKNISIDDTNCFETSEDFLSNGIWYDEYSIGTVKFKNSDDDNERIVVYLNLEPDSLFENFEFEYMGLSFNSTKYDIINTLGESNIENQLSYMIDDNTQINFNVSENRIYRVTISRNDISQ